MPPDPPLSPRQTEPPGDPWLFILLGPFLGVVAAWLWAQAADNPLESLARLVVGGSLFLTLGLFAGGISALLSVAYARWRERQRREDEAREKQKTQEEK